MLGEKDGLVTKVATTSQDWAKSQELLRLSL